MGISRNCESSRERRRLSGRDSIVLALSTSFSDILVEKGRRNESIIGLIRRQQKKKSVRPQLVIYTYRCRYFYSNMIMADDKSDTKIPAVRGATKPDIDSNFRFKNTT